MITHIINHVKDIRKKKSCYTLVIHIPFGILLCTLYTHSLWNFVLNAQFLKEMCTEYVYVCVHVICGLKMTIYLAWPLENIYGFMTSCGESNREITRSS